MGVPSVGIGVHASRGDETPDLTELVADSIRTKSKTKYVKIDSSSPDAVVQDGTDIFESEPLCKLLTNQTVEVLDSTDGEYVKIRAQCDGKVVEGWVKARILVDSPIVNEPRVSESGATGRGTAIGAAPGTIAPGIPDPSDLIADSIPPPWKDIHLTDHTMKPGAGAFVTGGAIPLWIPITAGAAAAGTAIYFIARDDGDGGGDDPTELVARDDNASVPCDGSTTVNVLDNDSGDGLFVKSVQQTSDASTTIGPGNSVVISDLQTTSDFSFSVVIGDAHGQEATSTVFVTVSSPPVSAVPDSYETPHATVLTENVLSNDNGDDISVTDYTQPSSGSATITPEGSLTYTPVEGFEGTVTLNYTITGPCDKTSQSTVTIKVLGPDCEFEATITTTDAHCGSEDGTATITVDPPGAYTYAWSNGATGASEELGAGNHMVTITSPDGNCVEEYDVTIGEIPADLTGTFDNTPASCGIEDGSASVEVTPSGSYTYQWSNGATGNSIQNVSAGEYQVTVTIDGTDCTVEFSTTIDETPPEFEGTIESTPAGCGQSDGSATITITPDGDYTYQWSNGATGNSITDVEPGDYSVTVTITGTDCSKEFSVTIEETEAEFDGSFSTTPANCGMSDGSATIEITPGGQYQYEWSNGSTDNTINDVPPGTYQVTVTIDGTECSKVFEVTIDDTPAEFDGTITSSDANCGLEDGSAQIEVTPAASYSYEWSNGETTSVVDGVGGGEYQVTVTDENGCTKTFSTTVGEIPADYITDISTTDGDCLGEGADISVTTQTPGSGPMEITATGPDGQHMVTAPAGATSLAASFTILPGTWLIEVRDSNIDGDCSSSMEVTVEDNTQLTATDDTYETVINQDITDNVLDNDEGLQLEVTANTEPSAGTLVINGDGSFTYTPEQDATGDVTFEYTVTDACGNTATAVVTIIVNPVECTFEATFDVTDANCGLSNGAITTTIDPDGNYSYEWSNGSTSASPADLDVGSYSVTITDNDLNCHKEYSINVEEVDNTYIDNITTTDGSCTGGGEIEIDLSTPGSGPLIVDIIGPEGTENLVLDPGVNFLSDFFNVVPGDYEITVYDQGAGEACSESTQTVVNDDTPDLTALDDNYSTPFDTPLSDNALDNDSGLDIEMTEVSGEVGGTVVFDPSGDFTFTPDQFFSGTASFTYTVEDACGNTAQAEVIIEVGAAECEFEATFQTTNAACGLETGSAITTIDIPGNYSYQWSNGSTDADLIDVGTGTYSVTITENDLNCDLEFSVDIGEDPAMHVSDIDVTQPTCSSTGLITFTAFNEGPGPLVMQVIHPGGTDEFDIVPGPISLADFVPLIDGDYTVTIWDQTAGMGCSDGFDATLDPVVAPVIAVEAIIPPSEPTAEDGSIIIAITTTTTPPYSVNVNGEMLFETSEPVFTIPDLGAGFYSIFITDANGCISNILDVEVPLTEPLLELGAGFATMNLAHLQDPGNEQPPWSQNYVGTIAVMARANYVLGGFRAHFNGQFVRGTKSLSNGISPQGAGSATTTPNLLRLDNSIDLKRWRRTNTDIAVQAGIGVTLAGPSTFNQDVVISPELILQTEFNYSITPDIKLRGQLSLRAWDKIQLPTITIGLVTPLLSNVPLVSTSN